MSHDSVVLLRRRVQGAARLGGQVFVVPGGAALRAGRVVPGHGDSRVGQRAGLCTGGWGGVHARLFVFHTAEEALPYGRMDIRTPTTPVNNNNNNR